MTTSDMREEWVRLSKAWIREAREGSNPTRTGLLDAPMIDACGDVTGLTVLDCGCGEGRFCRILAQRGATSVLGLDLCEPMILAARELQVGGDIYQVADVQQMDVLMTP